MRNAVKRTIIVGLGNPGEKFNSTRHNAGFMAVDFFAAKNNFPEFTLSKKYNAFISEQTYSNVLQNTRTANGIDEQRILLVKPQTFMNNSGQSVKAITKSYLPAKALAQAGKLKAISLIVIHDDIDLPLGSLKISKDSGAGGHKGVDSIIQTIGTKDFVRVRIGICPKKGKPAKVEGFVIKRFTKEDKEIIETSVEKAAKALDCLIEQGLEKAMNQYN